MDINTELAEWKQYATEDADLVYELQSLDPERDQKDIYERFYRDLEFGTGGLRGVLGAGTNRMNIYVIRKVTQGLCDYLKSADQPLSVAIGHDSRIGDWNRIDTHVTLVGGTIVENETVIYSSAMINHNVTIENNARVAACSFVIRKVKSGTTVVGNPAKVLM